MLSGTEATTGFRFRISNFGFRICLHPPGEVDSWSMMDKKELEHRTKRFAIRVIKFANSIERSSAGRVIGKQLLRSGTSIGANYREANRAQSRRDFAYRIKVSEKEASETLYWLEICADVRLGDSKSCGQLVEETKELLAIFTAVGRTIRSTDARKTMKSPKSVSEPDLVQYSESVDALDIVDLVPATFIIEDDH